MLYIPVPINRRNHTKAAMSKCQTMLHYNNDGKYLVRRRKPNGAFQIVVRKKEQAKKPVGLLTRAHKVGWIPTIEIAVISFEADGLATAMPPTALVTEIAGVKTPSAMVRLKNLLDISTKVVEITHAVPNRHWKESMFSKCTRYSVGAATHT